MGIVLNNDNYYSEAANRDYMSVSQFKDFAGTIGHAACEAAAYNTWLQPQRQQEWTKSTLIGSYVDRYFEGTLDQFKEENSELLCTKASIKKFNEGKGSLELFADFKKAEAMIARLKEDPVFMDYCSGDTQTIMTANLFNIEWKIKMDFYKARERIADLKIMKDMKPIWSPLTGQKMDFIRYWGYDIQGAIYQKVVELNTGMKLPFYICCATKEDMMDYSIIEVGQNHLDAALEFVKRNLSHVLDVKNGLVQPIACGTCAHCRKSRQLKGPVSLDSIIPAQYGLSYEDVNEEEDMGEEPMIPGQLF